MRLKKTYSSREVASMTGLTARQLQLWDASGLLTSTVPSHKTVAGGYTERRYTPIELFELMVLADLRHRGFTVHQLHEIVRILKQQFGHRLFDATGGGGSVQLLTDGREIYARTSSGAFYNLLKSPGQPLLVIGNEGLLKALGGKAKSRKKGNRKLPDRKNLLEVVRRPRNDVDADELADAAGRGRACVGGRFHGSDVAAHDGGDQPGIDLLPADEDHVRGLHHRIGGFDHADQSSRFDHAERVANLAFFFVSQES